ncbi:MAG TPA: ribonuclease HII [Candidatus Cloacimonadota bacterium]|nr:ribonuclease HII [Candidatus Cloacimonadota bacterium]
MILFENELPFHQKYKAVAGIDEAGRGPLAGPVVVAAVILDGQKIMPRLNDSKKISAKLRERLFVEITEMALAYEIVSIPPEVIDEINILQASLLGMRKAAEKLKLKPDICLIDGNQIPIGMPCYAEAFVKGDGKLASIAAASILAKVSRDRQMDELHEKYPQYGFDKNRGYPTKSHLVALEKYGILPCHRKSYKPVQQMTLHF